MTDEPKTKTDTFFAVSAMTLFVGAILMIIAGIWLDPRWYAMAVLSLVLAVLSGTISNSLDEKWAKEGRKP
jgi:peptidoglycan biosynthesis protein MviN/MurJ (putative lipid II flippase)